MRHRRSGRDELIVSYMFLRKTVGWIGTLLPFVLILGNAIFFTAVRPDSMSGYYYTHMRNVFVGALCALGIFLIAYDGYDEVDRWVTNAAGFCAIGVAFFPTKPPVCPRHAGVCPAPWVSRLSAGQQVTGGLHLFFAATTFIALALMALRFAKTERTPSGLGTAARIRHGVGFAKTADTERQPRMKWLKVVYRSCGLTILSCIVLAALSNLLPASVKANAPLLFIFEALAVFAFGVSWFVKGETLLPILKNQPRPPQGSIIGLQPAA
jgi:hypothetical protein